MGHRKSDPWALLAVTRFLLAMIVLFGHLDSMPRDLSEISAVHIGNTPSLSTWWTSIGTYLNQESAVFGFLLISGYSIAASLDRSEPGYLWRRVRRIFPTYLASLGLAALAMLYGAVVPEPGLRFLVTAVMLQTFVGPTVAADGQLWTVAVEWWNYMLAPLYRRLTDLGPILLGCISLAIFLRVGIPDNPAPTSRGLMFALLSWFWIAGFLYYRRRRTAYGYVLLIIPLAIAASFAWVGLAVWISAAALAICEDLQFPEKLRVPSRWLGDLSYPIYAVHIPVLALCLFWGVKASGPIALAVFAVAIVVLHAIDLPVRSVGRRRTYLKGPTTYATAET